MMIEQLIMASFCVVGIWWICCCSAAPSCDDCEDDRVVGSVILTIRDLADVDSACDCTLLNGAWLIDRDEFYSESGHCFAGCRFFPGAADLETETLGPCDSGANHCTMQAHLLRKVRAGPITRCEWQVCIGSADRFKRTGSLTYPQCANATSSAGQAVRSRYYYLHEGPNVPCDDDYCMLTGAYATIPLGQRGTGSLHQPDCGAGGHDFYDDCDVLRLNWPGYAQTVTMQAG